MVFIIPLYPTILVGLFKADPIHRGDHRQGGFPLDSPYHRHCEELHIPLDALYLCSLEGAIERKQSWGGVWPFSCFLLSLRGVLVTKQSWEWHCDAEIAAPRLVGTRNDDGA